MVVGKAERTNGVDGWGVVSVVTRDGYDWSAGSLGKGSARRASRRQITSKDMRPGFLFLGVFPLSTKDPLCAPHVEGVLDADLEGRQDLDRGGAPHLGPGIASVN